MLSFLSDLFGKSEPVLRQDHMTVLASEENVISFDYTLAQVDAETQALTQAEAQQTLDHNQYY